MCADPTFGWKLVGVRKGSETGLKPSETVGRQLYPLILHLYGNLWTSQRGLKPSETGLKPSLWTTPVLLCTTKNFCTTPYYKVLRQYYSSTAPYYKVVYSSTTLYYKVLL